MKVIIAGSESINNMAFVQLACYRAIQKWRRAGRTYYIKEVVCNEAGGVNRLAKQLAAKGKMPVKTFSLETNKYGKQARRVRNLQMLDYADALIAVWDGKSFGTRILIEMAKKKRLRIYIYKIEQI